MQKKVVIDIGDVTFKAFKTSKSIKVLIRPFKGIIVTYPKSVKIEVAESFLKKNKNNVLSSLEKIRAIEARERQKVDSFQWIDKQKADLILKDRLELFSKNLNLPYNKVTIKQQKTRWGSCSVKNNINLNRFLVYIPAKLRDYVIVHELTHTKIKNHSKDFWKQLEKYYPNCRIAAKELNSYKLPML